MKLAKINAEIFNQLAFAEPNSSIYQSTYFANYMSRQNYRPVFLQAINDSRTCIGLAMFLIKKKSLLSRKNVAYCPSGYLMNYYDKEELIAFNELVSKYLKDKENVDTVIIEPNLVLNNDENRDYLRYALENIGYRKEKDIDYYQIDIDTYKKIETSKNLSFDISRSNNIDVLKKYIDSDENDYFEQYKAFSKYGSLYEASLDSFRSKSSLKKSMDENREFIHRHKDDFKYNDVVKEKIYENEKMDLILEYIAKYERTYGDNPSLGVTFITDYSDQHLYEFFISRDTSENLFEIQEVLLNYIVEDFKNSGIKKLSSYKQIPNAEKLNIIGQYISSI